MSRITDTLTAPQVARARMRAGGGFEAEASVTVTPVGLLAVGGMVGAILLSTAAIVRAARRRSVSGTTPEPQRLRQEEGERPLPALPPPAA